MQWSALIYGLQMCTKSVKYAFSNLNMDLGLVWLTVCARKFQFHLMFAKAFVFLIFNWKLKLLFRCIQASITHCKGTLCVIGKKTQRPWITMVEGFRLIFRLFYRKYKLCPWYICIYLFSEGWILEWRGKVCEYCDLHQRKQRHLRLAEQNVYCHHYFGKSVIEKREQLGGLGLDVQLRWVSAQRKINILLSFAIKFRKSSGSRKDRADIWDHISSLPFVPFLFC